MWSWRQGRGGRGRGYSRIAPTVAWPLRTRTMTGARTGARLVGLGGRCYSGVVAPVAQRIEHRPPEPVAGVRVAPGALHHPFGAWRSGSALGLGPRGRQFKPARPDQLPLIGPMHTCVFPISRKPEEGIYPRSHNGHSPSTNSSRAQQRLPRMRRSYVALNDG